MSDLAPVRFSKLRDFPNIENLITIMRAYVPELKGFRFWVKKNEVLTFNGMFMILFVFNNFTENVLECLNELTNSN